MTTKTQNARIERVQTLIHVPHNDRELTFVYSAHGPNTYANVQNSIEQAGLNPATIGETASLLHPIYCGDLKGTEEGEFIEEIMKYSEGLWSFTGTLFVPKEGAYVQDHPEIRNGMPFMDKSELIKKLEANDPSVRFVPFGFRIGSMSARQLASNPYVQALAGQEGAVKLGEIADTYKVKPYLCYFENVDQPTTRVSLLGILLKIEGGLDVRDISFGEDNGYAFGVRKTQGDSQ